MPKQRQGNGRDDASATTAMMTMVQGDARNDASAAKATMPKRRQGDGRNDASAPQ